MYLFDFVRLYSNQIRLFILFAQLINININIMMIVTFDSPYSLIFRGAGHACRQNTDMRLRSKCDAFPPE